MTEAFRIREFHDDDREFVVACIARLQNHEVALHDTRRIGEHSLCERYLDEILSNARDRAGGLLVACVDDRPVGFICFWVAMHSNLVETDDSNRCGYISDVFVVEDQRGNSFARRMFDDVQDRLMQDPTIRRLRICSLAANILAVTAYERAGFHPYEVTFEKVLR